MPRVEHQLDDRLYPAAQPPVLQGKYRGRKKRIFNYQQPGSCIERKLVSTNGWHRIIVYEDGHETFRTPASRNRKALMTLLGTVPVHSIRSL